MKWRNKVDIEEEKKSNKIPIGFPRRGCPSYR